MKYGVMIQQMKLTLRCTVDNADEHSNPYITMIMWLSLFLITFQSTFMLPDSAMQEILHFLKVFFAHFVSECNIYNGAECAIPGQSLHAAEDYWHEG